MLLHSIAIGATAGSLVNGSDNETNVITVDDKRYNLYVNSSYSLLNLFVCGYTSRATV
jgi:hypothetical protein